MQDQDDISETIFSILYAKDIRINVTYQFFYEQIYWFASRYFHIMYYIMSNILFWQCGKTAI